jgi:mRNA interferase MazF
MDLQRYDVIKAKIKYEGGSVQTKERPYVIVSNPIGTKHATIITVMPLTSKIKKTNMPVHGCLEANGENGLQLYSMVMGEQIITISKTEVIEKLGAVTNKEDRRIVDQTCFNGLFFGTWYKLEEARA